jgi:hypothetical protein
MRRTALCALSLLALTFLSACSDKRPIKVKEVELTALLESLRAASAAAAAYDGKATTQPRSSPVLATGAPYRVFPDARSRESEISEGNTLLLLDKDIAALNTTLECGTSMMMSSPPEVQARCRPSSWVGYSCIRDVASVLKFGEFPDRRAPHKGSAICAEWLAKVEYALVVHLDSGYGDRSGAIAQGHVTLLDLKSQKALARIALNERSEGVEELRELEGKMFYVLVEESKVSSAEGLVLSRLASDLPKVIPSAKTIGIKL